MPSKYPSDPNPSFTIFNKLPQETRLMIWEAALPGPQIVHVKMKFLGSTEFGYRRVRSDRTVPNRSYGTWPGQERYDEHLHDKEGRGTISATEDNRGWDTDDDL